MVREDPTLIVKLNFKRMKQLDTCWHGTITSLPSFLFVTFVVIVKTRKYKSDLLIDSLFCDQGEEVRKEIDQLKLKL